MTVVLKPLSSKSNAPVSGCFLKIYFVLLNGPCFFVFLCCMLCDFFIENWAFEKMAILPSLCRLVGKIFNT